MPESKKRNELQGLAEAKIISASVLLDNERFADSYYLAGYAVELGLKAVIAKQISAQAIPDKNFINKIYTHNISELVKLGGLVKCLQDEQKSKPKFGAYWGIVGEWSESARYSMTDPTSAKLMVQAVSEPDEGVLRWIRQHW